jgi:hypothetical protein
MNASRKTGMRLVTRAWALLAALAVPVASMAASGAFTYVTGDVSVESQGRRVAAIRGMEVNAGDLVITGKDGMAQLSMIDDAKLSLRGNSQLRIESYAKKPDDQEGAVLSLIRGTLRTFTGLLSPAAREKYVMKTRVATVGIRGSGNILNHEEDANGPVTINHTIEGSHVITSLTGSFAPIVTLPNDTVRVEAGKPPERIPTPPAIVAAATTMATKEATASSTSSTTASSAPAAAATSPEPAATTTASTSPTISGSNGLGFAIVNTSTLASTEPSGLRDIVVVANGNTSTGESSPALTTLDGGNLRGYQASPGTQSGTIVNVAGGTATDVQTVNLGAGVQATIGRWTGATNISMPGFSGAPAGSVHWGYASAGYPVYLSDVLTGTASYTRAGATSPTDQLGTVGQLTSATLDVNFTTRALNASLGISMPAASGAGATTWTLSASNVPVAFNSFLAISGINMVITNTSNGQNSSSGAIFGTLEGSFVGSALNGALISYGYSDSSTGSTRTINGVVAFQGPQQSANASYRDGLVSDPTLSLLPATYIRSYTTTDRPDEVVADATGRVTAFTAPYVQNGFILGHQSYAVGSAQIVDNGIDATTGLVWGRWSGNSIVINGQQTDLPGRSLHYIFSATQNAPVSLPLTGTGVYDVIGSTHPTDVSGHVGVLNSATLNANFTNRTVDTTVNLTINNQTWNASASAVPIYRDQYFSAYGGPAASAGQTRPSQLVITCTPNCGTGTGMPGSVDGFFTGRTGQGAGLLYNLNNSISGAVAFSRRGG